MDADVKNRWVVISKHGRKLGMCRMRGGYILRLTLAIRMYAVENLRIL
jgi:hypothetical protein